MLLPTLLLSLLTPDAPMDHTLHPDLQRYVDERVVPAMAAIPAERRESLDLIATFVKERKAAVPQPTSPSSARTTAGAAT